MGEGEFVTVGQFNDAIGAELARAKLESAGVTAYLGDEATVSLDWQLTNALGGIRLRVAADAAAAARAILQAPPETPAESPALGDTLKPREVRAERAAKMALFGCMFAPLLLYALWLIVRVQMEPGELRPMIRRQLRFAMVLALGGLAGFTAFGVFIFTATQ